MLKTSSQCDVNEQIILQFKQGDKYDVVGIFKRSQHEQRFSNDYNMNVFYRSSNYVSFYE